MSDARALCEQGLWPDVLAFAQKWHAENPADHRALYYAGLGFSGTNQFAQAESAYRRDGYPGAIPPNSTLIFEVELLDIG